MANFIIIIVVISIFAALSLSVISGIILVTENFDDVKLEIPELIQDFNPPSRNETTEEIKSDSKSLFLNETNSNQDTTIALTIEKFTTPEATRLRISGDIVNLDPWEKVYIIINEVDTGKTVVTHSLSLKGDGHEFGKRYHQGFGYYLDIEQFNPDVLYELTVSHNNSKVSETFFVNQLPETISLLTESKPKFEPVILFDNRGERWTSHLISKPTSNCGNVFSDECFIHMSEIDTPYGKGIEVDSSGSSDWDYWFMGISEKYKPIDNKISVSGKFLLNDSLFDDLRENRSKFTVYLLSSDGNQIIEEKNVVEWNDLENNWKDSDVSFQVSLEEVRIGIGRNDSWLQDWNLFGAWADVKINGIKLS